VKPPGHSLFYNEDMSEKFPFSWTDNPWHYKGMRMEDLSADDKRIVKVLERFSINYLLRI